MWIMLQTLNPLSSRTRVQCCELLLGKGLTPGALKLELPQAERHSTQVSGLLGATFVATLQLPPTFRCLRSGGASPPEQDI